MQCVCVIAVFVQRRSTDEEILFGDFCIQLPPLNVKSNETNNTKSEGQSCLFCRCAVSVCICWLNCIILYICWRLIRQNVCIVYINFGIFVTNLSLSFVSVINQISVVIYFIHLYTLHYFLALIAIIWVPFSGFVPLLIINKYIY